jgi:hypothetical protein
MAAKVPIFEQRKLNGVAQFLLQDGDSIDLDGVSFSDEIASQDQKVAIIDIHWTSDATGMVITYGDTSGNVPANNTIQLYGNGAWARTNGFYPIASDDDIVITGNGTVQILVKKLEGYAHRDDR